MKNNKQELREQTTAALKKLSQKELEAIDQMFIEKVLLFLNQNPFKTIGIYLSFGVEAPTHAIIEFAWSKKIKVYVPRIVDEKTMEFYEITGVDDFDNDSKLKMQQPKPEPKHLLKKANDLDVLFIPLTVFDERLNRIGSGYGYYDRWIKTNHYQGLKVGLARQLNFSSELITTEKTDIALDYIISEDRLYGW